MSAFPSFISELDSLLDELELFGFPRKLGKVEMESMRVLDLLRVLMDSLWILIQSKHRDQYIQGDESEELIKVRTELNVVEADFQRLQTNLKQKNNEMCSICKEVAMLKVSVGELNARVKLQNATIRQLKSQVQKLVTEKFTRESTHAIEVNSLKERLTQSLGLGISHGSRRPNSSERLREALKQEVLLKEVIIHQQETIDVLAAVEIAGNKHRLGENCFQTEIEDETSPSVGGNKDEIHPCTGENHRLWEKCVWTSVKDKTHPSFKGDNKKDDN